jgi:hypothetical protein
MEKAMAGGGPSDGAQVTINSRHQWQPREESGMDARRIVIVRRFGRRLLWCTLGAMLALSPGTASAQAGTTTDACTQAGLIADATNDFTCQNQTQAAVGYNGSQTQGWAYYCGGDHSFFAPGTDGIAWDNTCFTETENGFLEGGRKADATYTNWCVSSQSLVVVLACYDQSIN